MSNITSAINYMANLLQNQALRSRLAEYKVSIHLTGCGVHLQFFVHVFPLAELRYNSAALRIEATTNNVVFQA